VSIVVQPAYPRRYRAMPCGPVERAFFHAERAALLHEADVIDAAQRALGERMAEVRTKLACIRVVMWPHVEPKDIVHGFRYTRVNGTPAIPPVARNALPLRGQDLRCAVLAILARHGRPMQLVEIHRALHLEGYAIASRFPVKRLADALGYETNNSRAIRVDRGVYRLGFLSPKDRRRLRDSEPLPGDENEESRDRRGVSVLGSSGEEPFGGHRLLHPLDEEPMGGHGIDVTRDGTVHERQDDAGRELFHRDVFREVRPDAPVLLLEDVVDDPSAVRRLQQRMIQEEQEATAGHEHPSDLGNWRDVIGNVFEHEADDNGVEQRRRERQRVRGRAPVQHATAALGRDDELSPRRINADDQRCPALGRKARDLSLTRADVEHALRAREQRRRERKDLLFVFRIGAVGEPVLPPRRMAFPIGQGVMPRSGARNWPV
jgi:hypothetical protein